MPGIDGVYPDCPVTMRLVQVGGLTKPQIIQQLQMHSIMMNASGEQLFSDNRFQTSENRYFLQTVELTVSDLGFPEGATLPEIYNRASEVGLTLCPLELGPHLRLAYLDQPEGSLGVNERRHQAPYGSITIASELLTEDDSFPRGFYLRRINGVLWLRGYHASNSHGWSPDDHLIFCQ